MNENLENKVCLITGATNGIGLESARALNKMGAEIVFIARNLDKAEKLKEELLACCAPQKPQLLPLGNL